MPGGLDPGGIMMISESIARRGCNRFMKLIVQAHELLGMVPCLCHMADKLQQGRSNVGVTRSCRPTRTFDFDQDAHVHEVAQVGAAEDLRIGQAVRQDAGDVRD